ncbi:putative RNase H-like HicB family nuclease [Lachnospiraceae bacterium PF1-21]|uniref:type II toxin-antitoxin system HicB family antitoxin n=1 Tax=Ohessyouella blattaphilus TaxID=2949333 RepID=UPI003E1D2387
MRNERSKKAVYPVIFTHANDEDVILVYVPDMDISTQGYSMSEAIEMARDAIGLKGVVLEERGEEIPTPTDADKVDISKGAFVDEGKSILSFVDVDFTAAKKISENKMVRTNVTIPAWLKKEADREKINISKTLQEALNDKLKISN